MTDYTDLCKRLRDRIDSAPYDAGTFTLLLQAADAIERESKAADMIAEERDAWEKRAKALEAENARLLQLVLSPGTIPFNWKELEADNAALTDAMQRIVQWADAYPLDVFTMPDWKKARQGLATVGITLDAVSAANMRHVVEGVGKIARAALLAGKG